MESLSPVWKVPQMAYAHGRVGIMLTIFEQVLAKKTWKLINGGKAVGMLMVMVG